MIRTVIADDDFLVRTYLKQLKAWEQSGYEIIADLRDGEETLKSVEELGPELVVTDISMPLMDGIELIRKIRERNQSIYVIVLSCHDDFEYVKEAMKMGADEYVLKNSLNEESLYEMLENTKRQMEKRCERFKETDETRRLMEMGRNALRYHFFNGLLSDSFSCEEREKKRVEAGIQVSYANSAVINMQIHEWGVMRGHTTEIELEQYIQRFLQKLLSELKGREEAERLECVYLGEGVFCCFIDLSDLRRSSLMKQRLTSIATACFRYCKEEAVQIDVGVSSICFGEDGIRQAYQQAREMSKLSFYMEGEILYYEESPKVGNVIPEEAKQLLQDAASYVERQEYCNLKDAFIKAMRVFEEQHTDSRLVIRWIKEMDHKLRVERTVEAYAGILKLENLTEVCEGYQRDLFMKKRKDLPENVSAPVRMVVDFLHAHYQKQVGLSDAALAVNLNPAYVSYLFKQEMGIGFSVYLLDLRMECAKGLLQNTNDKIKDVAAKSGFNDYHYFSKAFKKIQGMSPADYRKQSKNI